jgi:chemosensory pili system protein ChpA (sensor histidine kinase/response regulator)
MKYSALTWVKATIDENLKQTRQGLEQFVEYSSDTAPLQQCAIWLHEIYGALRILELPTAALLVQEVELTIKSLLANKIDNNESTYDVLMRALIQLPNYLDHLAIVQHDIPLALLPLLNDLRTLRKQPALAANSFFTPDLSATIPNKKAVNLPEAKFKKHMQQMRAAYQKGLATIIKNPKQPAEGLKFIYTIMQRLQSPTGNAQICRVWWVTEAIMEALLQKGLVLNKAILNLLKQLDALINQAVVHGNAALRATPPKALFTNLLYIAAQARSKGKQITLVKTTFQLNDYFPQATALATAKLMFTGPDIELMKIVVTLLRDDFARAEEILDIYMKADNSVVAELRPLVILLRDMANTLGLLGLKVQRQSMLAQATLILNISTGRQPPEFPTLLNIASALLKIDAAVEILAVQGVHAKQHLQQSPDTDYSETPQFGLVLRHAVDEAKVELSQVIQPLVTFIDTGVQDNNLLEVPDLLKQVEGCLYVLSHNRAAKLLGLCNKYIKKVFIKEGTVPPSVKLKALADVLICIDLYLDTLAGNPMDADEILKVTERQLRLLNK